MDMNFGCFVLTTVYRVTNETTGYDQILLISVLHCNIYVVFKILIKFCNSISYSMFGCKHVLKRISSNKLENTFGKLY